MKNKISYLILVFLISNILITCVFASSTTEHEDFTVASQVFQDGFYDIAKVRLIKFLNDYPKSKREAQILLLLGQCYHQTNDSHKAVLYLEKALKANGAKLIEDVIYFWLGELALKAEQFQSARKYYDLVIKNHPESEYTLKSYNSLAKSYYKQHQYMTAIEQYNYIIKIYPNHPKVSEVFFRQGICWFQLKDYNKAKDNINKFLSKSKTSNLKDEAFYYLAECHYNLGYYGEAIDLYKKALDETSNENIKTLSNYGTAWCYLELSSYQESIEYFSMIYDKSRSFKYIDSVIYGIGKSFQNNGSYNKALQWYEELINEYLYSQWLDDAYLETVNILFELQRYSQALDISQKALLMFRESSLKNEFIYNQGWIYVKLNNTAEAIKNFEEIMQLDKGMLRIRSICRIGDMYFDNKQYYKAIDYYDVILDQHSKSPYAYYAQYWLGMCLYNLENYQGAAITFQTFLKNYPNNYLIAKVKFYLAQSLFHDGKYRESEEYFKQLAVDYKDNKDYVDIFNKAFLQWGNSLYNSESYQDAIDVFKKLSQGKYSLEVKQASEYQLGWCYYQSGREDKALEVFGKFLNKYPESDYSADIRFWFGDFYYSSGNFLKAKNSYAEFISHHPKHKLVYNAVYWMGWSDFKLGNQSQALEEFRKVYNKSNDESLRLDSKVRSAEILIRENKSEDAINLLNDIIQNSNNAYFSRLANRTLGDIYNQEKKYKLAIKMYENAISKEENSDNWNGYLQFHIALNNHKSGNIDKAITEYLKIGYLYPDSVFWKAQGKLKAAKILEQQSQWQKALKLYKDLLTESPDVRDYSAQRIKQIESSKLK